MRFGLQINKINIYPEFPTSGHLCYKSAPAPSLPGHLWIASSYFYDYTKYTTGIPFQKGGAQRA